MNAPYTISIRPIKTEEDHDAALARLETLWDAKPGTPEYDELEMLGILANEWEKKHYPMDAPIRPVAAIEFHMDQMKLTRKDLEPLIGSLPRVSEVLAGKRPLTLGMIRRIHDAWGIPYEDLIADSVATKKTPKRSSRVRAAHPSAPRFKKTVGKKKASHRAA